MSKQSGLGDQLFVAGLDIGGDIQSIGSLSTPRSTLESTGITASAMERLYGNTGGMAEFTSFFNDATDAEHDALSVLPNADVHLMYLRGTTLGNASVGLIGKQVSYDGTRGDDGSFTFGVSAQSNGYTAEWGRQLTAGKATHSSATNGSSIDTTASAAFGYQAYLQVFSLGSGTATVTIQDSANNSTFAEINGGATFTNVTGSTVQRIASASVTETVRRYIRVSTSGTFTDLVFAVSIVKNAAARII